MRALAHHRLFAFSRTAVAPFALAACGSSANSTSTPPPGPSPPNPSGDPPSCTGAKSAASTNPPPNNSVAGALDSSGTKFVVFGGDTAVPVCGPPSGHAFIADTYVLDVGCGAWTKAAASGPTARGRQAMALDPTANRAVLFGGRHSSGGPTYETYSDVWTFDFATSVWQQMQTSGARPSGRASSAAVVDPPGNRLVVFGGNTSTDGASFIPQNDTWALDLGTGVWTRIATGGASPPAREFHAMAIDPDGQVAYVFAGGGANAFVGPFLQDVWALDLTSDTWKHVTTTGTGPGGRIQGGLVFDTVTKTLIAFAGHDDGAIGNENDLYSLDVTTSPATWTKLALGDTPGSPSTGPCLFPPDFTNIDVQSPERRSAFAYAPRIDGHGFVVFGGGSDCGLLADAWWWSNGSRQWTNVKRSPVGLSCTRAQTTCKGLCG